MEDAELAEIADDLYSGDPETFVARRDTVVKALRAEKRRDLATQVKSLRRPTVSAALVNTAARNRLPSLLEFLTVGEELRRAQVSLDAPRMRELTADRQRIEQTVLRDISAAAEEAGTQISPTTLVEIEATLRAAVADPAASAGVASGRLTRALSYAGFGEVDMDDAVVAPGAQIIAFPGATQPEVEPEAGQPEPEIEPEAANEEQPADATPQVTADGDDPFGDEEETDDEFAALEAAARAAEEQLKEAQRQLAAASARRELVTAKRTLQLATAKAEKALENQARARRTVEELQEKLTHAGEALAHADDAVAQAAEALASAQQAVDDAEARAG